MQPAQVTTQQPKQYSNDYLLTIQLLIYSFNPNFLVRLDEINYLIWQEQLNTSNYSLWIIIIDGRCYNYTSKIYQEIGHNHWSWWNFYKLRNIWRKMWLILYSSSKTISLKIGFIHLYLLISWNIWLKRRLRVNNGMLLLRLFMMILNHD